MQSSLSWSRACAFAHGRGYRYAPVVVLLLALTMRIWSTVGLQLHMNLPGPALMINGVPGPMATEVVKACLARGVTVAGKAFTGPGNKGKICVAEASKSVEIDLVLGPGAGDESKCDSVLSELKQLHPHLYCIDYTHPSATLSNALAYARNGVPFVMGTTGGDLEKISQAVKEYQIPALIAPNMAKQIVAMQAALEYIAERFPGSFQGYSLSVTESHQSTKADTSGTAKAVVGLLNTLTSHPFDIRNAELLREREKQLAFGVPEAHLNGHAFHTYTLTSDSVEFQLKHNVCGRRIYAEGTVDAALYLHNACLEDLEGSRGRIYNMIDVLEAKAMS